MPKPATGNLSSAPRHQHDVAAYVMAEVMEVAMQGPFTPWCQVNAVLIQPKKDIHPRRDIMDISWLHPPAVSVNGYLPKATYLSELK